MSLDYHFELRKLLIIHCYSALNYLYDADIIQYFAPISFIHNAEFLLD